MTTTLDTAAAAARHIPATDFKPCAEAFIDRRNPNSEGKLNYSFIGPGVAQSDSQEVNMPEAHGFNVGGVTLPRGRLNNLHLHFTAEVFIAAAGEWEFIWGNDGENSASMGQFDTFTIPTWIFRGFLNRSQQDDGFMFAVLGGDDTGGIIWNPKVLEAAEEAGLRLTAENRVLDVSSGDQLAQGASYMKPVSDEFLAGLPQFTPEQMEKFIIRYADLDWRTDALPGNGLKGNGQRMPQLAPVLGASMTAARHHWAQVEHPHGFSLDWLRLPPGTSTGSFRSDRSQVAIAFAGRPEARINRGSDSVAVGLDVRSIYSPPAGCWRSFANEGDEDALLLIANAGGERLFPEWDSAVIEAAKAGGAFMDADRYLSPLEASGQ